MTTTTPTAVRLTAADLERLELDARADLTGAIVNLTRLREGAAHEVAGFPTWHAYVLARFGDLLAELRGTVLPVAERQELVLSMRAGGPDGKALSLRTIADRLHIGLGTVSADVADLRAAGRLTAEPTRTASRDGRDRPARTGTTPAVVLAVALAIPAGLGRKDEALLRVAAAAAGLTSTELDAATGWPMGSATGALSKLERAGLLARLGTMRGPRGVYTVTDGGRDRVDVLRAVTEVEDLEPVSDLGGRFVWDSGDLTGGPLAG